MRYAALFTIALITSTAFVQANDSSKSLTPFGEWWTPGFNARVRLEPCADAVCGRIVWMWDESPKDIAVKNALVGRTVVEGMRTVASGRWSGGRLYNPEDGRNYKGSLELQTPTRLVVDGCVLFICKMQIWRRVDEQRCPPVAAP